MENQEVNNLEGSSESSSKKTSNRGGKGKPRRRLTQDEIIRALEAKSGYIYLAAEALGVTMRCIEKRINKSKELQLAYREINEKKLDFTESALMKLIKKGNLGAICFHLKCKGKHRGWIERQEITGMDGDPINIVMIPADRIKKVEK